MSTTRKTETIGLKVTPQKKEDIEELAHERRTTVSELLRCEIDELLESGDVALEA